MITTERTYYSISDLIDLYLGLAWDDIDDSADWLDALMVAINIAALPAAMKVFTSDAFSKRMFADFIRRCWNEEITYSDKKTDEFGTVILDENPKEKHQLWCQRAASCIKRTLPQHKTILSAYESKAASLLAAIHSVNKTDTKNNDMPVSEVDLTNHLSGLDNVTSTVDDDGGTTIARLNELQRLYDDEMLKWTNEFASKFSFEALE